MNFLIRLGMWWESRRKVSHVEMKKIIAGLRVSPETVAELARLDIRLSQIELYVGLKREPKPSAVPGMAKIQ
jgi:hypothetical protein